jgi:hypothetical protein
MKQVPTGLSIVANERSGWITEGKLIGIARTQDGRGRFARARNQTLVRGKQLVKLARLHHFLS